MRQKFLYDLANKQNIFIFTDWIFIFHPSIIHLKTEFLTGRFGKIKNISMNRLNKGPVRQDVNARIDLAVHDVSIVQYLFNKVPKRFTGETLKEIQNLRLMIAHSGKLNMITSGFKLTQAGNIHSKIENVYLNLKKLSFFGMIKTDFRFL